MNTRTLRAHFVPEFVTQEDLRDSLVVIIDILRASTTISYALANGAKCIHPFLTVEETREWKLNCSQECPDKDLLIGGERGGKIIEGFDLGNSPADYTCESVNGKVIGFTTSNGTKAMTYAALAKRVFIGCFANADTLLKKLLEVEFVQNNTPVHLLCAGTNGKITREDVLFAGKIVSVLASKPGTAFVSSKPLYLPTLTPCRHL